ncbi:hypothetical protein DFH11DRAFT_1562099 [Phellopilus nigrolimitatus]|nr:hypothetical protein DFH11DRAFT_1562099 [Phellopilus nigrolimitatus]
MLKEPGPSFSSFKFNMIGQRPVLLDRFTARPVEPDLQDPQESVPQNQDQDDLEDSYVTVPDDFANAQESPEGLAYNPLFDMLKVRRRRLSAADNTSMGLIASTSENESDSSVARPVHTDKTNIHQASDRQAADLAADVSSTNFVIPSGPSTTRKDIIPHAASTPSMNEHMSRMRSFGKTPIIVSHAGAATATPQTDTAIIVPSVVENLEADVFHGPHTLPITTNTLDNALALAELQDRPVRSTVNPPLRIVLTPLTELLNEERAAWGEAWECKRNQVDEVNSGDNNTPALVHATFPAGSQPATPDFSFSPTATPVASQLVTPDLPSEPMIPPSQPQSDISTLSSHSGRASDSSQVHTLIPIGSLQPTIVKSDKAKGKEKEQDERRQGGSRQERSKAPTPPNLSSSVTTSIAAPRDTPRVLHGEAIITADATSSISDSKNGTPLELPRLSASLNHEVVGTPENVAQGSDSSMFAGSEAPYPNEDTFKTAFRARKSSEGKENMKVGSRKVDLAQPALTAATSMQKLILRIGNRSDQQYHDDKEVGDVLGVPGPAGAEQDTSEHRQSSPKNSFSPRIYQLPPRPMPLLIDATTTTTTSSPGADTKAHSMKRKHSAPVLPIGNAGATQNKRRRQIKKSSGSVLLPSSASEDAIKSEQPPTPTLTGPDDVSNPLATRLKRSLSFAMKTDEDDVKNQMRSDLAESRPPKKLKEESDSEAEVKSEQDEVKVQEEEDNMGSLAGPARNVRDVSAPRPQGPVGSQRLEATVPTQLPVQDISQPIPAIQGQESSPTNQFPTRESTLYNGSAPASRDISPGQNDMSVLSSMRRDNSQMDCRSVSSRGGVPARGRPGKQPQTQHRESDHWSPNVSPDSHRQPRQPRFYRPARSPLPSPHRMSDTYTPRYQYDEARTPPRPTGRQRSASPRRGHPGTPLSRRTPPPQSMAFEQSPPSRAVFSNSPRCPARRDFRDATEYGNRRPSGGFPPSPPLAGRSDRRYSPGQRRPERSYDVNRRYREEPGPWRNPVSDSRPEGNDVPYLRQRNSVPSFGDGQYALDRPVGGSSQERNARQYQYRREKSPPSRHTNQRGRSAAYQERDMSQSGSQSQPRPYSQYQPEPRTSFLPLRQDATYPLVHHNARPSERGPDDIPDHVYPVQRSPEQHSPRPGALSNYRSLEQPYNGRSPESLREYRASGQPAQGHRSPEQFRTNSPVLEQFQPGQTNNSNGNDWAENNPNYRYVGPDEDDEEGRDEDEVNEPQDAINAEGHRGRANSHIAVESDRSLRTRFDSLQSSEGFAPRGRDVEQRHALLPPQPVLRPTDYTDKWDKTSMQDIIRPATVFDEQTRAKEARPEPVGPAVHSDTGSRRTGPISPPIATMGQLSSVPLASRFGDKIASDSDLTSPTRRHSNSARPTSTRRVSIASAEDDPPLIHRIEHSPNGPRPKLLNRIDLDADSPLSPTHGHPHRPRGGRGRGRGHPRDMSRGTTRQNSNAKKDLGDRISDSYS